MTVEESPSVSDATKNKHVVTVDVEHFWNSQNDRKKWGMRRIVGVQQCQIVPDKTFLKLSEWQEEKRSEVHCGNSAMSHNSR